MRDEVALEKKLNLLFSLTTLSVENSFSNGKTTSLRKFAFSILLAGIGGGADLTHDQKRRYFRTEIWSTRQQNDKPSKSSKWTFEQLNAGQSVLSLQTGTNKFASQKGMSAFGSPRANIYRSEDRGFVEPDRKGQGITRAQCGTNQFASQKGSSPFLACRPNVCRVQDKQDWLLTNGQSDDRRHQSDTIIPMQAGSNKFATQSSGQVVIGGRRNQCTLVRGRLAKDRRCEQYIPFQSGTNVFASQSGMTDPPAVGAYRQTTIEPEGLNFTEEQLRRSTAEIPWFAGTNKFATQTGSGGFSKQRDVIFKSTGGKEMPEEMARKCDGILRLQFGTNKLANQSGMTGFGTPRSVLLKPKWKSEWIEEYEQARAEWQSQEEKRREEEHGQHATDERRNSDDQDDSDGDEADDDDDVEQIGSTVRIYGPRTTETN
ncbi:Uncharacterized protein T12_13627 [Trichinella patagoniensis]|uniref:Calponin-like protein OV9M n=1 Tax=Trichinella patagoniensis TaxID=990121 RepID=A0A0V0ZPQ2_9BILA|nr:Uncharacterized protein T12_13627 [Trichinella patagoniensis]